MMILFVQKVDLSVNINHVCIHVVVTVAGQVMVSGRFVYSRHMLCGLEL